LILLLAVWAVLVTAIVLLAKQNLSVPGLYYDEAVFAGLAKDFITGHIHGQHMPNNEVAVFLGRPFPVFRAAIPWRVEELDVDAPFHLTWNQRGRASTDKFVLGIDRPAFVYAGYVALAWDPRGTDCWSCWRPIRPISFSVSWTGALPVPVLFAGARPFI